MFYILHKKYGIMKILYPVIFFRPGFERASLKPFLSPQPFEPAAYYSGPFFSPWLGSKGSVKKDSPRLGSEGSIP